jgi:hypothetical protein
MGVAQRIREKERGKELVLVRDGIWVGPWTIGGNGAVNLEA